MATRYNLISPRKNGDKTFWHRVGTAFPRDKGGFSLIFDSLPLPDADGRVSLLMTEPLPEDGRGDHRRDSGAQRDTARQSPPPARHDLDDEIPF